MNDASKTETLMGGVEVGYTLMDGGTGTVFVRQLPVRCYQELQRLKERGDEVGMVVLYCGEVNARPHPGPLPQEREKRAETDDLREWAEGLMPESHERIVLEGERVNGDFFGRWLARQPKQDMERYFALAVEMEKANPGMLAKMMEKEGGSPSPRPSPPGEGAGAGAAGSRGSGLPSSVRRPQ